jgi:hypothetical protein
MSKSATNPDVVKKPLNGSTFAEKAKNGMLRQTQNQAKSVSSYLNKIGAPTKSSILSKPKPPSSIMVSSRARVTLVSAPTTSRYQLGGQFGGHKL